MSNVNYSLSGGLTEKQIDFLYKNALAVIEKIGVDVPHQKILKLLAEHSGVSIKGTRVFFKDWLVQSSILKEKYQPYRNKLSAICGVYCLNILDFKDNIRPATTLDLKEMVKLADSLDIEGEAPVEPSDIHPKLRQIAMKKICWENSKSIRGGYITDIDAAEYIYEMSKVAGKSFSLGGTVFISPLRINTEIFDLFFNFADRNIPIFVGGMSLLGASAPIYYLGAYIQGMAEIMFGITLMKLIFNENKRPIVCNVYPFDMKYQTVSFGSPEKFLLMQISMQIAHYFGLEMAPDALMCTAKSPDVQASSEKMAQVLGTALAGASLFRYAGTLSQDEIFSPVQLIIDKEIVDYVAHITKGFESFDNTDFVKLIGEGIVDNTYLTHETTLDNFRDVYTFSDIFQHESLAQWKSSGKQSIYNKVKKIAQDKITKHDFRLSEDIQKEIDKIYEHAKNKFLN